MQALKHALKQAVKQAVKPALKQAVKQALEQDLNCQRALTQTCCNCVFSTGKTADIKG
jgi:hypothetical protein